MISLPSTVPGLPIAVTDFEAGYLERTQYGTVGTYVIKSHFYLLLKTLSLSYETTVNYVEW